MVLGWKECPCALCSPAEDHGRSPHSHDNGPSFCHGSTPTAAFAPFPTRVPPLDTSPIPHLPTHAPSSCQVATDLPATTAGGKQVQCAAVQLPYRGGEYYAVAAMPAGEWAAEPADNGQRALATPAGPVPYGEALAACRQAVSCCGCFVVTGWTRVVFLPREALHSCGDWLGFRVAVQVSYAPQRL